MQAVVLVGGEGTRLRPLTYGTPKPMVPIMNVPFLERTLVRLREAGIDDVILPAGYLPQAITGYFGDGAKLGIHLTYVIEETPLNTAGALKNIADHITGPFFVLNGDVLTSLDLRAMMAFHREHGGAGVLHAIRVEDPSAFGCILRDADGRIRRFVEKPPREQAPTNEINAGTYLLEREILDWIPAGRPVSIERETFPLILEGDRPLHSYVTDDYWIDLGRPEAYLGAHRDIFDGKMPLALGAGTSGIAGPGARSSDARGVTAPSYVGAGVTIEPGARVGPYAVIGDGCRIERGAVVSNTILWDGVHVGAGARVEGAIIAARTMVGAEVVIKPGAVIGHGAEIEAGALVAGAARIMGEAAAVG